VNVTLAPSHHTAGTKHKRRDRQFITGGENNLQFLETCLQTSSPILFLKTVYKNYLKNSVFKQIRLKSFSLKKTQIIFLGKTPMHLGWATFE
jgi:hypothetical protein